MDPAALTTFVAVLPELMSKMSIKPRDDKLVILGTKTKLMRRIHKMTHGKYVRPLKKFRLFSKLPRKIQARIWAAALPLDGGKVEIVYDPNKGSYTTAWVMGGGVPRVYNHYARRNDLVMMGACSLARMVTMQHYHLAFADHLEAPVYFNRTPGLDHLSFTSVDALESFLVAGSSELRWGLRHVHKNSSSFENVKKIVISPIIQRSVGVPGDLDIAIYKATLALNAHLEEIEILDLQNDLSQYFQRTLKMRNIQVYTTSIFGWKAWDEQEIKKFGDPRNDTTGMCLAMGTKRIPGITMGPEAAAEGTGEEVRGKRSPSRVVPVA